ncbi:MAG: hypothetical protein MUC97_08450 [Bernardetiaceae bacterium]|nr:hypothetical protein [Bernardetiaceae bacterium]
MTTNTRPAKPQKLSPEKFFTTGQARALPFLEAWLNPNWQRIGFACVMVARKHPNGKVSYAGFLIDVFCLGIKDTLFEAERSPAQFRQWMDMFYFSVGGQRVPIDYPMAHQLVWGAWAYADKLGFSPHEEFAYSQFIMEEQTAAVALVAVEFGKDGIPVYFPGPHDDYAEVLAKLRANAGEGNFDVVLADGDTYLNLRAQGIEFSHETITAAFDADYDDDYEEDDYGEEEDEEEEDKA